jgi:proton glutamate symport protein
MPNTNRLRQLLKSPWLALLSIALGSYVGVAHQPLARSIAPLGDVYLALLEMFILPIVVTALIHAIGRIIMEGIGGRYLRRVVMIFILGMMATSLVALAIGLIIRPGATLGEGSKRILGETIIQYEQSTLVNSAGKGGAGMLGFLQTMIPGNIFAAASNGNSLALVFFCIITGIALGLLRNDKSNMALRVVEAGYDAFMKIISWIMYALPLGLFCLVAAKFADMGSAVLSAMGAFIGSFYLGAAILIVCYLVVTAWRSKGGMWAALKAVKEPLIVAVGTSSRFAAIPAALRAVSTELRRDPISVNLVIPLGMNINLQGSAYYFTLAALFTTQLYGHTLTPVEYLMLPMTGIFAAIAASDAPGIAAIGIISIILEPLGIPSGVTVILLSVIDPIIDPIVSVADVHGNCASALIITAEKQAS